MSNLSLSNIVDRATGKSLGAERVIEGTATTYLAAAIATNTPVTLHSFNVSSLLDNGLGYYGINVISSYLEVSRMVFAGYSRQAATICTVTPVNEIATASRLDVIAARHPTNAYPSVADNSYWGGTITGRLA